MTPWQWIPAWLQVIVHAWPLSLSLSTCEMGWTYDADDPVGYPTVATVVCESTTGGAFGIGHVTQCTWKGCS